MDQVPSKAASKWSAASAVMLILLPLAYVASTGPVVLLVDRGWISESCIAVYYPLIVLCERWPLLANLIDAYVEWWM